jgi:glycosyltransferase involved in cell wall biosynthesis
MKIILINYEYPPYGGGAGNATREIARALVQKGHEVDVLTGGEAKERIGSDNINVISVGSSRQYQIQASLLEMASYVFYSIFWILRTPSLKYDLCIVFFALPCGPVATLLKLKARVPYVLSLRGGDVPGVVPTITRLHRCLRHLRQWVGKNAEVIIANSVDLGNKARTIDGFEVEVVPNGVDYSFYNAAGTATNRSKDNFHILIAGRFHRQKKIPETLQLLAELKKSREKILISIVGDGSEKDLIEGVISQNRLENFVRLEGWVEKSRLVEMYRMADCFVNFSSYEGMPNTVLEAMACGVPVIVSNIEPHKEIIDHGISGFLINLDEPSNLFSSVRTLIENPSYARKIGLEGRARVLRNHSWTTVAEKYLNLGLKESSLRDFDG